MVKFYIGINPRWQSYSWMPRDLNLMYSATGFWDGYGWRRGYKFINHGLKFLDCGGFTAINKYGDFPFTAYEYLNLVAILKPHYYATMDYPCEPEISRLSHLSTNRERIDATVDNAKWFKTNSQLLSDGISIPVIQGYTVDEYKFCIDQHYKSGTIADYMAVGSMCRRLSSIELSSLIPGIAEYASRAGVTKLHWFGLKLDKRLDELSEFIYSQDSAVALDGYDKTLRQKRGGRRYPRGQEEKREAFMSFLDRIATL